MHKSVLYIGNNLFKKTNYITTIDSLSNLLAGAGFNIYKSSSFENKFFRIIDMCLSVIRYHKKVNYVLIDTYSTSNFYYALFSSQICRFFNLKYIPILHGGNLPNRLINNPFLSYLIFNNSFINVAPSEYLKDAFESRKFKVLYIPNVISIRKYNFKKRQNLSPKLLYVRSFAHIYNPIMAVEVLNLLKKKYSNACLCMIGPFKDDSIINVKDLIKKYNLENDVEITGVLTKKEWHKKSEDYDIFINTTNIDNTPVSVIEAMALGLTIVSTNVGGIPYLINDKNDGVLVDKNDIIMMNKEIIKIVENNNYTYATEARKKAEGFDEKTIVKKWVSLLQ